MKFGRCIERYVVAVYAVNDTGKIYNALRKFGTLEFVRCMGENVVNGVRSNEVRLYCTALDFSVNRHDTITYCYSMVNQGGGGALVAMATSLTIVKRN